MSPEAPKTLLNIGEPGGLKREVLGICFTLQPVGSVIEVERWRLDSLELSEADLENLLNWIGDMVKDSITLSISRDFDTERVLLNFSVRLPVAVSD